MMGEGSQVALPLAISVREHNLRLGLILLLALRASRTLLVAAQAFISKNSAEQRKGRAGRTGDGRVFRIIRRSEVHAPIHMRHTRARVCLIERNVVGASAKAGSETLSHPPSSRFQRR